MDPGQIIYLAVIVFVMVAGILYNMGENKTEGNRTKALDLDLSDVPDFFDDEETRRAKEKRLHERIWYRGE